MFTVILQVRQKLFTAGCYNTAKSKSSEVSPMLFKGPLCGALCAMLLLSAAQPALADEGPDPAGYENAVTVTLDGETVRADGKPVPEDDPAAAVYTARDIVYYEAGHDFTYGEGTAADEHTAAEAAEHTVVHIARPGTYVLQGTLEKGQIAVDLGEDAASDPDAVVTLVLDGADIICTVAPAVIFYNVYECDQDGTSGIEPDLSGAGARVVVADGSVNNVTGSYVARIYKSYTLNEDGTAVADSKKLHKYDGAFYSKMSMLVSGGTEGTGVLNITAENEGLDTEMHLTIDGGNINIRSGNDGINVNEDDLSVVTVNGGVLSVAVTGETGEGDGIDSNGALVVNAGTVTVQACSRSADAGLDAATGIYLNGGMVIATGSMLDSVEASDQCCAVFAFPKSRTAGARYALTDTQGNELMAFTPENDFSILLMTCPALEEETEYSLSADGAVIPVGAGGMDGGFRGGMGSGPAMPDGQRGDTPPEPPEGVEPGEVPEPPEGMEPGEVPEPPEGVGAGRQPSQPGTPTESGETFTLSPGLNMFSA